MPTTSPMRHFTDLCKLSTSSPHGTLVSIHLSLDLYVSSDKITDQTLNWCTPIRHLTLPVCLTLPVSLLSITISVLLMYHIYPNINHVGPQQQSRMTHYVHHLQIERNSHLSLYLLGCMSVSTLFTD